MFKDVYVQPSNETPKQLHAAMVEKSIVVFQKATSQLPSKTPIEDVTIPEDVDGCLFFQIEHSRGRCIEGGSGNPKGLDLYWDGERPYTSHTDVRPPNLATSTSSCSTFDLKATSPYRYSVA
ncbi:hypothetical protein D8674_028741 [Pyrus ussuriensis x Pyrus communis]|uniref:Uncharacterized protein n=1 Tax=Pyrus ussuriensis x Pyrus communis TaxID=2448454 RepID=A0A5N5IAL6_9ROSA|nr:hypothetical protein D8674_028741 [Pyrus ussuriensis x Pyrus communis]